MTLTVGRSPALRRPRSSRLALAALGLGVLAVFWAFFAPTAIGGSASYVITDGTSMLPRFHADGLVITRQESSYHVGEVVAYHNRELHTVVMHRIVAIDGDRYVFKGDNNNFRDDYRPTKSELVGREWAYWPGGGEYLGYLRNPLTFAVLIGLITLWAVRPTRLSRRQRRRHHAH